MITNPEMYTHGVPRVTLSSSVNNNYNYNNNNQNNKINNTKKTTRYYFKAYPTLDMLSYVASVEVSFCL